MPWPHVNRAYTALRVGVLKFFNLVGQLMAVTKWPLILNVVGIRPGNLATESAFQLNLVNIALRFFWGASERSQPCNKALPPYASRVSLTQVIFSPSSVVSSSNSTSLRCSNVSKS